MDLERKAKLDQQQNQRDFDVRAAGHAAAVARAAASARASAKKAAASARASAKKAAAEFDITGVSKDKLTRELRLYLKNVQGKDKKVSPENLAKAYNTWQAAGLDAPSFWKNYQGVWNPKQKNYGDQFHYFVSKGV
jgi:hypothetical protein